MLSFFYSFTHSIRRSLLFTLCSVISIILKGLFDRVQARRKRYRCCYHHRRHLRHRRHRCRRRYCHYFSGAHLEYVLHWKSRTCLILWCWRRKKSTSLIARSFSLCLFQFLCIQFFFSLSHVVRQHHTTLAHTIASTEFKWGGFFSLVHKWVF